MFYRQLKHIKKGGHDDEPSLLNQSTKFLKFKKSVNRWDNTKDKDRLAQTLFLALIRQSRENNHYTNNMKLYASNTPIDPSRWPNPLVQQH